jgi:hypothetical protein
MVATLKDDATERVGKYDMQVRFGERTEDSEARWQRRSEVLAAWLREQWDRQQREQAERN